MSYKDPFFALRGNDRGADGTMETSARYLAQVRSKMKDAGNLLLPLFPFSGLPRDIWMAAITKRMVD